MNHTILQQDESKLREVQIYLTNMYKQVNQVLQKYDVQLIAGGGTLLGAIRHNGFIPWDDDLDFLMMRSDYEKLKKAMPELEALGYILLEPVAESGSIHHFLKLKKMNTRYVEIENRNLPLNQGIFIDIFVIENVPNNRIMRIMHGLHCLFLFRIGLFMVWAKYSPTDKTGPKNRLKMFIYKCIGFIRTPQEWVRRSAKVERKYQHLNTSEYVAIPNGRFGYFREMHKRDVLLPGEKHVFEDTDITMPKDAHAYLVSLYGETYMTLPAVEDREYHHVYDVELDDSFS